MNEVKLAEQTPETKSMRILSFHRWRRPAHVGLIILLAIVYQFTWFVPSSHVAVLYIPPPTSYGNMGQSTSGQQRHVTSYLRADFNCAYAFIISGCDPRRPSYRDYIYNVLIATRNLRRFGSKAKFVVYIQMSWKTNATALPIDDERLLKAKKIKIKYLPKHERQSFYRTMLDKFRILGLTEYDRVLLLDADVMPMGNLDYLFHLSQRGVLRENLIVQGVVSPANGGFFMLKPVGLAEINEIIQTRQREARDMGRPYFNDTSGWGHVFHEPDDIWASLRRSRGDDWTFYGAYADQGLLYYWVKYVRKDVSICYHNGTVQNWYANSKGDLVVESLDRPFVNYSNAVKCWGDYCMSSPMRDYIHFTGRNKSWLQGPPKILSQETRLESAVHFWFWQLKRIDDELKLGLQLPHRWRKRSSTFGLGPNKNDIVTANVDLTM